LVAKAEVVIMVAAGVTERGGPRVQHSQHVVHTIRIPSEFAAADDRRKMRLVV
jgi:hypothetical protein